MNAGQPEEPLKIIRLVVLETEAKGQMVIAAFDSRDKAWAFLGECVEYQHHNPHAQQFPDLARGGVWPSPEEEELRREREIEWEEGHPAGRYVLSTRRRVPRAEDRAGVMARPRQGAR